MVGRVLVCGPQFPDHDPERGSRRLWDFVSFLRDEGWAVSALAEKSGGDPRVSRTLRRNGIATYAGLNDHAADLIAFGRFDFALVSFWQSVERFLPLIRVLSPGTKIVVDSVDLQFVRSARQHFNTAARESRPAVFDSAYGEETARELSSYGLADLVLTSSESEADLFRDLTGGRVPAVHVPDGEDFPRSLLPFSERRGIVLAGNFRQLPDVEGLQWLLREVFPHLPPQLLVDHPLTVVGPAANDIISVVDGTRGVNVAGWVPEVQPYFQQSWLSLLPQQDGPSTRRKLIQSLMSGTPVVSTSRGLEGLSVETAAGALVADQPGAFARQIIRLFEDSATWNLLANVGRSCVRARHGREIVRSHFLAAIETLELDPDPVPRFNDRTRASAERSKALRGDLERLRRREPETIKAGLEFALSVNATVASPPEGSSDLSPRPSGAIVIAPFVKLDTLLRLCTSLLQCEGVLSKKLIFLQDSADKIELAQARAKEKQYLEQAARVRDFLNTFSALYSRSFVEIEVLSNDRNLGPYKTCQVALDHAFESVDFAIFAEDDVVFAPDAVRWFDYAREHLLGHENIHAIAGESWYFESGTRVPSAEQVERLRRIADQHGLVNKYLTMNWIASSCFAVTREAWREFGPMRGQVCGDVVLGEYFKSLGLKSVYPVMSRVKDVGMLHPDGHSVTVLGASHVRNAAKNVFLMSNNSYLIANRFEPYAGNEDELLAATSQLDDYNIRRLEGSIAPIDVGAQ